MKIKFLTFLTFAFLLFSITVSVSAQTEKAQVLARSKQAVSALKNKNLTALAALVHPAKGVRFSPYGNVDKERDLTFRRKDVLKLNRLPAYVWGQADGSGDDIKLNFSGYYKRFVYDLDFARAPVVSYNKIAKHGNTIVNVEAAYPNARFVEYHFPRTRKNEEMDWRSLRLVFEKSGKDWFLVGVSHDQWTI